MCGRILALLIAYHGTVTGVFTGDECIAGKRSMQGTELCAVIEHAYSLKVLLSVIGDPAFGGRLRKIVFKERRTSTAWSRTMVVVPPMCFPLLLRIPQDRPHRDLPHVDWEVHPTTGWNYALDVGEATLADDMGFREHPMGDCLFSPEGAPVSAKVKGRRVPQWQMENGSAADVQRSPITSSEPQEELILIPYGCTNLRITEFSVLER